MEITYLVTQNMRICKQSVSKYEKVRHFNRSILNKGWLWNICDSLLNKCRKMLKKMPNGDV